MVDQTQMDMRIKGSNNEPQGTNKLARKDRASWHCLASDSRISQRGLPLSCCNDPVKFSRVSNIEQRAALPSRHTPAITAWPLAPIGDGELDSAPAISTGASLPDSQTRNLSPRVAARPSCPKCQSRTEGAKCGGPCWIRALDPAVHQVRPYL